MTKLIQEASDAIARALKPEKATVIDDWHPLKKAIWRTITGEELNTKYVNAWLLTDKIFNAVYDETAAITTLTALVKVLEEALRETRDDLNLRAVRGVVAVGNSVWLKINCALGDSHE